MVTTEQLGEGALEDGLVQSAFQAQDVGHVVGGGAGLELVEEPQALLSEGEGQGA